MNVFPFIEAEKAEQAGNVAKACGLLEVSRSAYYDWSRHVPSRHTLDDQALGERIQAIYDQSRGTYGWPRVHRALRRDGVCASGKRVARIMRHKGLVGRCRRRWTKTTTPDPEAAAVDLIKRAFGPGTVETDRVYVGDITYVWTWEGWAYLATVIDLASRRVVGWALAESHREPSWSAMRCAWPSTPAGPGPGSSSTPTAGRSTPLPSSASSSTPTTSARASPVPASAGTTPWPRAGSPPSSWS